ncbi:dual CXXC motif small (seleno)protein [Desulfonema ishimotonii]
MRCRSCNTRYPLTRFAREMDDDLEERLANIPCNRL